MKINKTKGFSLVELVVVMAIFGIVATIGSLSWARYVSNENLRTAARELVTDFNTMKQRAVSNQDTTYSILFDITANNYTMSAVSVATGTTTQTKSLAPAEQAQGGAFILSLPGGATPTYTLAFLSRGTLNPPNGTIQLRNIRGSRATIVFNMTGKTYVTFAMQ